MNTTIEFSLDKSGLLELALFIAALNQAGVPFSLRRDSVAVALTVSKGF